jgi:hypothetical protein
VSAKRWAGACSGYRGGAHRCPQMYLSFTSVDGRQNFGVSGSSVIRWLSCYLHVERGPRSSQLLPAWKTGSRGERAHLPLQMVFRTARRAPDRLSACAVCRLCAPCCQRRCTVCVCVTPLAPALSIYFKHRKSVNPQATQQTDRRHNRTTVQPPQSTHTYHTRSLTHSPH